MKKQLQHTGRFGVVALLVGLTWYVLAFCLASVMPRPWSEFRDVSRLIVAISFAIGALVPAWLFRRQIAGARLVWAIPGTMLGFVMAVLTVSALLFASIYLMGQGVEEVQTESSFVGKLQWSLYSVLYLAGRGVVWAATNFWISTPIALGSLLCLRWASGGLVSRNGELV